MRIRVLRNYGGDNTNYQRIEPGDYDLSDPRLFGAGEYLLGTGEAIAVDPPPVVDVETEIETTEAEAAFEPVENTRAVKRKAKQS